MPARKKILHIITGLNIGGAETNLERMLPELEKYHTNVVCCLTKPGPIGPLILKHNIPIHYVNVKLKIFGFFHPAAVLRFYRIVQSVQPDIAITYLIHADLFGRFWGKLFGIPKIISWHRGSLLEWEWLRSFDTLSSFLVSKYIFQTHAARMEARKFQRIRDDEACVIPNAVRLPDAPPRDRKHILHSVGIDSPQDITIICVSNLRKGKGHPVLLRAFEDLYQTLEGHVNLLLVGDGKQRPILETLRAQMNAKERIFFAGQRNDVPSLLAACDIFVLPTFYEGMSNAILEAMSIGCAVVSTDIAVNRDIIRHNYSGLLVPIKDSKKLKEALEELVRNTQKRQMLSKNAKEFVTIECSPLVIAKKVSQVIVSIT